MNSLKIILQTILFYPGTVLHETAHAITCRLLGGKTSGIILTPSIDDDGITFGSVTLQNRYHFFNAVALMAPIIWWFVAGYLLKALGLLNWGISEGHFIVAFNFAYKEWGFDTVCIAYGVIQLIWAGKLSQADVSGAIRSLLSISGLIGIVFIAAVFFVYFKLIAAV